MPRAHDPLAARAARCRLPAAGAALALLMAWVSPTAAYPRVDEHAAVPLRDGFTLAAFRAKPKPAARASGGPSSPAATSRAEAPLAAVVSSGPGQAGYVHYFVIQGPDEEPEIQVGVELDGGRIAWSFPRLGVVVSPFMESGVVTAGGVEFDVWHLYGLRPFPDNAAMARLARELGDRVQPWLDSRTPHCEHEAGGDCMSCLGFVLRVLFPGRGRAPDLPRDWPAGVAGKYTTRDLLLYLTGMLHLPTREARLRRIAGQPLPAELREELEHLVYHLGAFDTAASGEAAATRLRPGAKAPKLPARPPQRRKL